MLLTKDSLSRNPLSYALANWNSKKKKKLSNNKNKELMP